MQCSRQQPHDPMLRGGGNFYTFHVEKSAFIGYDGRFYGSRGSPVMLCALEDPQYRIYGYLSPIPVLFFMKSFPGLVGSYGESTPT